MLEQTIVENLKKRRNLLAFSGGADSTALLFLLQEHEINFDIAIVDYGVREQSKAEVAYAKELAKRFGFLCFVKEAAPISSNFEAEARKIRYDFFKELIKRYDYDTLLSAHHLGDRLEWFLMQFTKGAGCAELVGMQIQEQRECYLLVRPLLNYDKKDILAYLKKNNIRYFHDTSNDTTHYKRNLFRHRFANELLAHYKEGIRRSFAYMDEDKKSLFHETDIIHIDELTCIFRTTPRSDLLHIDAILKQRGQLISAHEKELLKQGKNSVLGRKVLVTFFKNIIVLSPYLTEKVTMTKDFKEECRLLGIEPKLRPYLFLHPQAFNKLVALLKNPTQAT